MIGNPEKTRTSFVAAVIPPEANAPLLSLLKTYWPNYSSEPHITLMDPFLFPSHFPEATERFTAKLESFPPFEVRLTKFGTFKTKRNSILWVQPEASDDKLGRLARSLTEVYPFCDDVVKGVYRPHITIGRFKEPAGADAAKLFLETEGEFSFPITFTLSEIQILSRDSSDIPYSVVRTIPLGTA
jgi:2'-5' RNA ligase